MIDINIIKASGKFYSVKCSVEITEIDNGKTSANVKILNVDLVEPNGSTSYTKLKNMFTSNGYDILSKTKYKDIYGALTKKLIQKFKMSVLNI